MSTEEETYRSDGNCSRWGQEITEVDQWNTGTLHCSECGRATVVVNNDQGVGERRHAVEVQP